MSMNKPIEDEPFIVTQAKRWLSIQPQSNHAREGHYIVGVLLSQLEGAQIRERWLTEKERREFAWAEEYMGRCRALILEREAEQERIAAVKALPHHAVIGIGIYVLVADLNKALSSGRFEEPEAVGAVDPQAGSTGTPTPRVKNDF